ncbi:MAG TPA: NAD(P)-dependent oxidoreductase, partial [Burkholderiales bacterium]|nr:NAD(P)-dependent oxidoreductase [Burkholderiales bacterium]
GFRKVVFSGFTTIEMARIVETLLVEHPDAHGVWHVSSEPIDKCSLLELVKKHYGLGTPIVPADTPQCDRSLDSERFRVRFNYRPPSWDTMIAEMRRLQRV